MFKFLKYLWALPVTLFGLILLLVTLPSRPKMAWLTIGSTSALCVWGGWADVLLRKHPLGSMAAATLGHIVFARNLKYLCESGAHEYEHVRQIERWGVFMPLAYVTNGFWQVYNGKRFYRDNCFEEAAYQYGPERFDRR